MSDAPYTVSIWRVEVVDRFRVSHRVLVTALVVTGPAGCSRSLGPVISPGRSAVALSGGPNTSLAYLARTDRGGLIAIDLGWWGATGAVRRALAELGASPAEVTDVFLTHSHRDHIGAWRLVRGSRFHVATAERATLAGERQHRGWIPRMAERLVRSDLPRAGEVAVETFSRDTIFVFGADTVFAYLVPGHTAGSAVYRYRGILFLGDAVTHSHRGGFGPARRGYSDDAALAVRSLRALWPRLPAGAVQYVCTAHARCAAYSAAFERDVTR